MGSAELGGIHFLYNRTGLLQIGGVEASVYVAYDVNQSGAVLMHLRTPTEAV
jgi:hypothetical protein